MSVTVVADGIKHLRFAGPWVPIQYQMFWATLQSRSDTLEKLSVASHQRYLLGSALRPLLRYYVAHPKAVNQQNAGKAALMLAFYFSTGPRGAWSQNPGHEGS